VVVKRKIPSGVLILIGCCIKRLTGNEIAVDIDQFCSARKLVIVSSSKEWVLRRGWRNSNFMNFVW